VRGAPPRSPAASLAVATDPSPIPLEPSQKVKDAPDVASSSEPAGPVESAAVAPQDTPVTIAANERIVRLRVGKRTIVVAPADRTVSFLRSDVELGRELAVEATTTDGRRAAGVLSAQAASLRLVFARASRGAASDAPAARAASGGLPGLAPIPYHD
jgi:hypothetical protein